MWFVWSEVCSFAVFPSRFRMNKHVWLLSRGCFGEGLKPSLFIFRPACWRCFQTGEHLLTAEHSGVGWLRDMNEGREMSSLCVLDHHAIFRNDSVQSTCSISPDCAVICVWKPRLSRSLYLHTEAKILCFKRLTGGLMHCRIAVEMRGFQVLVGMVTAWLISPCPVSFHIHIKIRSIMAGLGILL